MVEVADRARERTDARNQFARKAHLELLVLAGEPAADTLEVRGPGEQPQRHREGRIELVEVPT
jgi:hypothetical protein